MERLDKLLCNNGIGSRSQIKQILKSGVVFVDGAMVTDGSLKIDPANSIIICNGVQLSATRRVVLMLNKPMGYVTATKDEKEPTVMELLPSEYKHLDLKPIGRLDKETEGLLLFTNDGDLLHRVISPKKEVQKVYYARHEGTATEEDIQVFSEGVLLRDGTLCKSAVLTPLGAGESMVTVCEGKYHQVRRMMASRHMTVLYLKRIAEGSLELGDLPMGKVRELSDNEITLLGG